MCPASSNKIHEIHFSGVQKKIKKLNKEMYKCSQRKNDSEVYMEIHFDWSITGVIP